jgi:hypothetical protein
MARMIDLAVIQQDFLQAAKEMRGAFNNLVNNLKPKP